MKRTPKGGRFVKLAGQGVPSPMAEHLRGTLMKRSLPARVERAISRGSEPSESASEVESEYRDANGTVWRLTPHGTYVPKRAQAFELYRGPRMAQGRSRRRGTSTTHLRGEGYSSSRGWDDIGRGVKVERMAERIAATDYAKGGSAKCGRRWTMKGGVWVLDEPEKIRRADTPQGKAEARQVERIARGWNGLGSLSERPPRPLEPFGRDEFEAEQERLRRSWAETGERPPVRRTWDPSETDPREAEDAPGR